MQISEHSLRGACPSVDADSATQLHYMSVTRPSSVRGSAAGPRDYVTGGKHCYETYTVLQVGSIAMGPKLS